MVSSTLTTLLSLSTLAVAVPHNKHFSFHFPHGTGTGGSFPHPTGGFPFPLNGTEGGPFGNSTGAGSGAESGSIPVVTMTVVPTPADTGVADTGSSAFTGPPDVNQGQGASTPVADASAPAGGGAGAGNGGDMCTTVTSTATSVQYVTVTAGAGGEGMGPGQPSVSGFQPAESSASLISETPSVSAGAFYGYPSGGNSWGGGWGGQSTPAVPTTLATSVGGGSGTPASSAPGSQSSTPSTGSGGGSSSGGKKGLSYNTASLLSVFDSTGMSWAYNWASSPGGSMPSGVEYVPMCWGVQNGPDIASAAQGASHVLSFNEPDMAAQANIDPQTAAENHIKYLNPLSAQVGSPAITNGDSTSPLMGIPWLNAFFKACAGQCKVDFVAFHWYASSSDMSYFQQHVQDVIKAAADNGVGKVWLTEFGTTDGNSPDFISQATAYLDGQSAVERYAYFMVDNILEQGGSLSAAGKAYAG